MEKICGTMQLRKWNLAGHTIRRPHSDRNLQRAQDIEPRNKYFEASTTGKKWSGIKALAMNRISGSL